MDIFPSINDEERVLDDDRASLIDSKEYSENNESKLS